MIITAREKSRLWLLILVGVVATLLGQTHAQQIFEQLQPASGKIALPTQATTGDFYDADRYDAPDCLLAAKSGGVFHVTPEGVVLPPGKDFNLVPMARTVALAERRVDKIGNIDNIVGMSRLTIEIEPEQHRQIKTLATFAGMTIKEFILSKTITPSGAQPQQPADTTTQLLGSPKNAKRLREAIGTKTPKHLIFETTEDLKRALGI